ncbi:DUF3575 domain-containing protein [Dyadobacter jiangsuensis]|uniref:Uncharacterized protein DUF3575 n=1 Tax=Dyadobacter jiangsuensis TaxID=1591085 RepID=A0A2P8GIQ7_9BACT|nr:DUF3575 domain-containing protein [Dyadobacter jiangsuensis]PSL33855.1 uncharacterized protein DUF3575 [Dyadobacter jiangsuensis]
MRNIFYFLSITLIFLIVNRSNAQRASDFSRRNIDAHIDLVPLGFTDPSIRFGSEMMFGNRWAAGLNLGVGVPVPFSTALGLRQQKWEKGKYKLFEVRPEVKYYWLKRERSGWYMAAEGLFSTMSGTTGKSYHFENNNDTTQVNFDYADFSKTKIGVTGKLGGRIFLGQRMTLDFFTGIGFSRTNSMFSNYKNKNISTNKPDLFYEGENYVSGNRITGHLSAGLRLGILLWSEEPK